MKSLISVLLISLLGVATHAKVDKSCYERLKLGAEFRKDPFFKPMTMDQGPYKGECLDNRQRRSVPLFAKTDQKLVSKYGVQMKPGHIYFGNFKYKKHYYIAEYPENSIDQSILIFEKFSEWNDIILTGHIQLRFKLKPGKYIKLYPQFLEGDLTTQKVSDFSYVMFAVRPQSTSGQKFDALGDGIHAGYVMSENFMSIYDVSLAYANYVGGDTEVGQYKIEKSHFDAEVALKALLKNSDKEYRNEKQTVYHTWLKNCVTSTYIGIDAGAHSASVLSQIGGVVSGIIRLDKTIGTMGKEWNPFFVLGNLERRGIIKAPRESELKPLNEEVCQILSPKDLGPASVAKCEKL